MSLYAYASDQVSIPTSLTCCEQNVYVKDGEICSPNKSNFLLFFRQLAIETPLFDFNVTTNRYPILYFVLSSKVANQSKPVSNDSHCARGEGRT